GPSTEVRLGVPVATFGFYLLHVSIELYLKSFILNAGKSIERGHSLEKLYRTCEAIDQDISKYVALADLIALDPFGDFEGGAKYPSLMPTGIQIAIQDRFHGLVKYINEACDPSKKITLQ